MNNIDYIEKLIQKFNDRTIAIEELSFLIRHFKENQPGNEMLPLYEKVWNEAEVDNSQIRPEKNYKEIIRKINTHNSDTHSVYQKPKIYLSIIKYAAVLIIGFALSFLFKSRETPSSLVEKSTYQQITVPYGSKSSIILPDGSTVVLNSGSKLKYLNDFGNNGSRVVTLEGEAFFNVKKDSKKPFYVNASGIKVKVLGTSFNVKAYPDEKSIETTLVTGAVEIFKDDNTGENEPIAVLKQNQRAILEKASNTIVVDNQKTKESIFQPSAIPLKETISIESEVETSLTTAWKDNKLIFNNELFSDITKRIERWYGVKIIVVNYPELEKTRLSGKFDKETVEQAISALKYATPFKFTIDKSVITIHK